MNRLLKLVLACLFVSSCVYAQSQVTVSDTLHLGANGALASGQITLSNPAFAEPDGTQVAASTVTVPVASDGTFSVQVFSTIGATLTSGSGDVFYTAKFYVNGGGMTSEKWYIPQAGASGVTFPLTIQEILKPNPLNLPVLSSLPSTCTAGATGFYNGNEYICTATNVWTLVPLDYSHLPGTPDTLNRSELGAANGVAGLDGNALLLPSEIPSIPYSKLTGAPDYNLYALKSDLGTASSHAATDFLLSASAGAANGIATLDANGKVPQAQIPTINVSGITGLGTAATHPATDFLFANILGQPNGAAQLDSAGKLSAGELPSLTTSQISDFPTALPPNGAASGDLAGTYPAPTVKGINGTLLSSLGAGILGINSSGTPLIVGNSQIAQAFGYTPADVAKNGSDFTDKAAFRANIGLGTAATQNSTAFLPDPGTNGIVKRTGVGSDGVAGPSDISSALGFTPADAAKVGAANGIASLDANAHVPIAQVPPIPFTQVTGVPAYVPQASVGVANGVASLDGTGKVPSTQIPARPFATTSLPGEVIVGDTLQISTGGNGNPAAGTLDVKAGQYDPAGAATTAQNNSLQKSANLSDVADAATARGNLGLGTAATHPDTDFIAASAKGVANGVATLDNTIKVPIAQIPNIPIADIPGLGTIATHAEGDYLTSATRGAANGVASLDATIKVPVSQIPDIPSTQVTGLGTAATHPATDFVATSAVGAANGVASLDAATKVPAAQIPQLPYSIISNPPTISAVGTSGNYTDLIGAPASLPPNGPAAGDLGGSYPNPTVTGLNGTKLSTLGAGLLSINASGIPAIAGASAVSGSLGYTPMNPANNLGDVADIPTARTVLGLNSAATHAATDFLADSGTNGIVKRTAAGITAPATSSDIITGIGYTPLNPNQIGAASGIAGLDAGGKVPIGQIPAIPYTDLSGVPNYILSSLIGAANGVASLDASGKVPTGQIPAQPTATTTTPGIVTIGSGFIATDAANGKLSVDGTLYDPAGAAAAAATASIPTSAKGAANGVATLDATTHIPIAQVPDIPYGKVSGAPTTMPPSGAAGGDLGSSYPAPTVVGINGQNLAALGAGVLAQSASGIPRLATGSDVTGLLGFTPVNAANIGVANGIAGLDATAKVPLTQIPVIPYSQLSGTPVIPPQYVLPAATATTLGGIEVGTGFNVNAAGLLSANFGTAQGTVMEGNDARVTGAVQSTLLGQPNGVATLNSSGLVPNSQLGPAQSVTNAAVLAALGFTPVSNALVGAASGLATLDANSHVPLTELPTIPYTQLSGTPTLGTIASHAATDYVANTDAGVVAALGFTPVNSSALGVANGVATLDATDHLTAAQLPTAIPYANLTGAPTGLPPNGPATGDLAGTYPAPTVVGLNGTNLKGLGAGVLKQDGNGIPAIAAAADITGALGYTPVNSANVGVASGVASLDSGGKVPLGQVPSLPYSIISDPPVIPPAYTLPVATATTLGGVEIGTGLSANASGVASVNYGTTSGTAAQGNDSRIVNAVQTSTLGAAGGVATLDGAGQVPVAQLPTNALVTASNIEAALGYTPVNPSAIGAANGIASLDATTKIPIAQIPAIPSTDITGLPAFGDIVTHNAADFVANNQTGVISALGYSPVNNILLGAPNGVSTLDSNKLVPLAQIPTTQIVTSANIINGLGYTPLNPNQINVANGVAGLDANAHVLVSVIPTGVPATDIGGGTVNDTAFGYLANVTSDIQTQLNGTLKMAAGSAAGIPYYAGTGSTFSIATGAELPTGIPATSLDTGEVSNAQFSYLGKLKPGTATQDGEAYVWNATNGDFELGPAAATLLSGAGIITVNGAGSSTISVDPAYVQTVTNAQQATQLYCPATSGSGSNYSCTTTPAIGALNVPMFILWKPDVDGSGGPTTLNVSGFGAKTLLEANGTNPSSSDIKAGGIYPVSYDGTNFRIIGGGGIQIPLPMTSGGTGTVVSPPAGALVYSTGSTYAAAPGLIYSSANGDYEFSLSPATASYQAPAMSVTSSGTAPLAAGIAITSSHQSDQWSWNVNTGRDTATKYMFLYHLGINKTPLSIDDTGLYLASDGQLSWTTDASTGAILPEHADTSIGRGYQAGVFKISSASTDTTQLELFNSSSNANWGLQLGGSGNAPGSIRWYDFQNNVLPFYMDDNGLYLGSGGKLGWGAAANAGTNLDTWIDRAGVGNLVVGSSATSNYRGIIYTGGVQIETAAAPSCDAGHKGIMTYYNGALQFCDGTTLKTVTLQ